jgi:hypothetical protein
LYREDLESDLRSEIDDMEEMMLLWNYIIMLYESNKLIDDTENNIAVFFSDVQVEHWYTFRSALHHEVTKLKELMNQIFDEDGGMSDVKKNGESDIENGAAIQVRHYNATLLIARSSLT